MSWDESERKIKCLWGNGFITQKIMMDDWNRYEEETPIIKCEECKNKYKIESKYMNPKPHHEYTIYYCVNKKTNEKIQIDL